MDRPHKTSLMTRCIRSALGNLGYEPKRVPYSDKLAGLSESEIKQYQAVANRTMVWPSNVAQAVRAAKYLSASRIPGAIVECGVWRGGVVIAMLRALLETNDTCRDVFLYDTYAGLPAPGAHDIGLDGRDPHAIYKRHRKHGQGSDWCRASLDDVQDGVFSVGYPFERIHFVKGKVEETLPESAPDVISLLRLDTDWYESTRHELLHLYPRLSKGGVLIIDDYGTWAGARKAVDEYLAEQGHNIFVALGECGVGYVIKP